MNLKKLNSGIQLTLCMMIACCLLSACHKAVVEQEDNTQNTVAQSQAEEQSLDTVNAQTDVPKLTPDQQKKIAEIKQFILDAKLGLITEGGLADLREIGYKLDFSVEQLFDQGARLNKKSFFNAMKDNDYGYHIYIQHAVADNQKDYSPICEAVRANNMPAAEALKNAGADMNEISDECIVGMISEAESASPLLSLGVEKAAIARALANVDDEYLTGMVDRFESINHILNAGISEERFKTFAQKNIPLWEAEKKEVEGRAWSIADYDGADASIDDCYEEIAKIENRIDKVKAAGYGSESAVPEPQTADNHNKDTERVVAEKTDDDTAGTPHTSADSTDKPSLPDDKKPEDVDSNQMIADNEDEKEHEDEDDASEEKSKCTSLFGMMEEEHWYDSGNSYETDEEAIRNCIKNGANVNERDSSGRTPIFEAFAEETIDILLENGADINAKDKQGLTPVMAAGANRDRPSTTYKAFYLIKNGAKVNIRDKQGQNILFKRLAETQYTPITYTAADYTDEEWRKEFIDSEINLLELCISKGADVKAKDKLGRTPIFYLQHPEGVKFFKSHGVDINAQDKNGQTALMVTHNPKVLIALLAAGADVNIKDKSGQTVFDIYKDDNEILMTLKYPFHYCELCSTEILNSLVSHGFDINARTQNNKTAIETAMERKDYASVFALFKTGADSNIIGPSGDFIVFDLIKLYLDDEDDELHKENLESEFEALVAHKTNVNLKNHDGKTPLMLLCGATSDYVQKLVNAGADVNAVDNEGRNALYYAGTCLPKYRSASDLSQEEQAILNILLRRVVAHDHRDKFRQSPLVTHDLFAANALTKAGFDINEKHEDGTTPFFMVLANHLKRVTNDSYLWESHCKSILSLVQLIKELRPHINETDNRGRTPLLYMLETKTDKCWKWQCNSAEYMMVYALIDNHADLNHADHEGRSPLMLAKCLDTAEMMVERGASVIVNEANLQLLLNDYEDCIEKLNCEDCTKGQKLETLQRLELLISQFESNR